MSVTGLEAREARQRGRDSCPMPRGDAQKDGEQRADDFMLRAWTR